LEQKIFYKDFVEKKDFIIKSTGIKNLKNIVIPYSDSNLKRLNTIFDINSNFFQKIISYSYNNFEIDILLEDLNESNIEGIEELSKKNAEKLFAQFIMVFEISKSIELDFIDFTRFEVLSDFRVKFSISMCDSKGLDIYNILRSFQKNRYFKGVNEKNYMRFFNRIDKYKSETENFYIYRYKDFASNILNLYPISELENNFNVRVNIDTKNITQKRIIKKNLYRSLLSEDLFFIDISGNYNNIPDLISKIFHKDNESKKDDFVHTINELKIYLDKSPFKSFVLMIDYFKSKEDVEFVKCLLDSSGISNIALIAFNSSNSLDFDLELKENPKNLLEKYLKPNNNKKKIELNKEEIIKLKIFKSISFPINFKRLGELFLEKELIVVENLVKKGSLIINSGNIEVNNNSLTSNIKVTKEEEKELLKIFLDNYDSLDLQIKYLIITNNVDGLKSILKKYRKNKYSNEINYDFLKKNITKNLGNLSKDLELIQIFIEILLEHSDLNFAKELIVEHKNRDFVFFDLKLAYIYKYQKNYKKMNQVLIKIRGKIPDNFKDEFYYLRFIYFVKISDFKKADRYLKKIKKEYYIFYANIQLVERYIYCGDYEAADYLLKKTVFYLNKNKYHREEIEAKIQVAKLLREKGDFYRAEELYKNIYVRSEIENFKLISASISVDLGNLFFFQDDFNQAEFWYKKALQIFINENSEDGKMLVKSNLVEINKIKGNWWETENYLKSILKYDKENNYISSIAVDFYNISHLKYLKKNYTKALEFIERAGSFFKKSNNLSSMIESEFLKLKIIFIINSKKMNFNFLLKNPELLSKDQKIILSLLKILKNEALDNIGSISKEIKKIESKTAQFEMFALFINKYKTLNFMESLRTLSMGLSKKIKNYYFYEFYYIYFDNFKDRIKEKDKEIFKEMYYFFLRNKRKISSRIINLKKSIDDIDSIHDIFKSAELVNDYIRWKVPEDLFKSFLNELNRNISADLVKLKIFENKKNVFNFSNLEKFNKITEEVMNRAIYLAENLNLNLEDVKNSVRINEKVFYPYKNTKIILWRISENLFGVLLLAFLKGDYFNIDLYGNNIGFFKKFASLIYRYYENDYKFNKKLDFIVGESKAIKKLKGQILKVSKVDFSLLITGESGTGKELVAKGVHLLSNRSKNPFIPVNSAAIPENLLEAELFGNKKGAFSGANEDRVGLIEAANNGTLFLDEIADLPLALQAKLLRVLQENEIRRLGENRIRKVDVRLISATNKNLDELIKNKKFREDLYFRIQDLSIRVPCLEERREDIPLLTKYFLKNYGFKLKDEFEFQRIIKYFENFDLKGNVRGLESKIKRLITFYPDFGVESRNVISESSSSLRHSRENFEKSLIIETLRENKWNKVNTAKKLEISRMCLFNLIKKYNITKEEMYY